MSTRPKRSLNGEVPTSRGSGARRRVSDTALDTARVVLLLSDTGDTAARCEKALSQRGYECLTLSSMDEAASAVESRRIHLMVMVLPLRSALGGAAANRLRGIDPGLPFIVIGTDAELDNGGAAFDVGAEEHLVGSFEPSELLATIGVLLGSRRGDRHLRYLHGRGAPGRWDDVIGSSVAINSVVDRLKRVCSRTFTGAIPTILLRGETGTGKGFIARCVHYNGTRRNRPFVEVNCAALPAGLIEAELFGHEQGSFTDAKLAREGLFETADGGTLWLDEIGALPVDLQAKVLVAIEERRVRRVGGRQSIYVDVQIVAATHEDLQQRSKLGTFREDLFHRLNVVSITIPPLRDRKEDIVPLAESFLTHYCAEYGLPSRAIDGDAKAWVEHYGWPGNVRELRNMIERIVLLETDTAVRAEHFSAYAQPTVKVRAHTDGHETGRFRVSLPPAGAPLEEIEREVIREALERCDQNVSRAARYLSVTRQTLMYRMRKHRLTGT